MVKGEQPRPIVFLLKQNDIKCLNRKTDITEWEKPLRDNGFSSEVIQRFKKNGWTDPAKWKDFTTEEFNKIGLTQVVDAHFQQKWGNVGWAVEKTKWTVSTPNANDPKPKASSKPQTKPTPTSQTEIAVGVRVAVGDREGEVTDWNEEYYAKQQKVGITFDDGGSPGWKIYDLKDVKVLKSAKKDEEKKDDSSTS